MSEKPYVVGLAMHRYLLVSPPLLLAPTRMVLLRPVVTLIPGLPCAQV